VLNRAAGIPRGNSFADNSASAFCEFYEEQIRSAFRLIADGVADDYLWDGWDQNSVPTFEWGM
jgi:hypothetical protein